MGSKDGIKVFDPRIGLFNLIRAKDLTRIKGGDALFPVNVDTIGKKALILGKGSFNRLYGH